MKLRIPLNNSWKVTGFGEDGKIVGPIDGTVPGHVHADLLREGLIPDPLWRDQALQTQWVESYGWMYETQFDWPEETDRRHATLCFEGLDTIASIRLNGKLLGTSANMFITHSFAAEEALQSGTNRLEVRFTSIPEYLQDKDAGRYVSLFSEDRIFVRRMQCTFGWDWVHRLVSYGIWRPVYIEVTPEGEIEDVSMRTIGLEAGTASNQNDTKASFEIANGQTYKGKAALEWEVSVKSRLSGSRLQIDLVDPDGRTVWENTILCEEETLGKSTVFKGRFELDGPRLWWPVGYGIPQLYELRAVLLTPGGAVADERREEIGIRTVEVEQIPDAQGSSFTVVINGQRIFAKGGNWVPADPFPSAVTKERYEHLLTTLAEGNMNMLRVWGGGTYELPDFWAACNRLGIMVSLDFMMACAQYPEHEDWFIDGMKIEVEHAVRELRNHPSLIFYCGDNELAMNSNPEDDYWGKRVCALVTEPLCAALDPSRPFFPTSPYLGRPFNSQDEGDCHFSTWYDPEFILGEMQDYRSKICEGRGRFLSECVVVGAPRLTSLLNMMSMEDVVDETAAMWEFRTKDNPYNGQDELTHYRMLEKTAITLFGESENLLLKVKKLEYVQYEFARLKGEHYRRRKYATSGLLFWMFNDCWPASGCSMVDYYGFPKAGYYGAKQAFVPLMVSFENRGDEIGIWIVNDTLNDCSGNIIVRSAKTDGVYLYESKIAAAVQANAAVMIGILRKEEIGLKAGIDNVVVQALWQPNETQSEQPQSHDSRAVYFDVMPKQLQLPDATLRVQYEPKDEYSGIITIQADTYARIVTIEEDVQLSDNYFDLMPGESRSVHYRTSNAVPRNAAPKVSCWNGK